MAPPQGASDRIKGAMPVSIKGGQAVWEGNSFVFKRAQTVGVDNLNVPSEKVYEVGDDLAVQTVYDIPDLSFGVESWDVSPSIEAKIVDLDPNTIADGTEINFLNAIPLDIIAAYKKRKGLDTVVGSHIAPSVTLERVAYRFATRQNATKQFTFRGDSLYWVPGTSWQDTFTSNGSQTTHAFAHGPALRFNDAGDSVYALGVCYVETDGTYHRLFHGVDYTDTNAGITFIHIPPNAAKVRVVYGSAAADTRPQTLFPPSSTLLGALRSKDWDLYVGTAGATAGLGRWDGVTGFELNRSVNLDNDEEFGNPHYVSQDYDAADVAGTITVRARDVANLFNKVQQATGTPANEVAGINVGVSLPMEFRLSHPETGALLETLYVPDAQIQVPPPQNRANSKMDVTFPWSSASGDTRVFKGARP
jgi:hypothetical protein